MADAAPFTGAPGTNKERTFLMAKPDAVARGLIVPIIQRFQQKGFKLVAMKMMTVSRDLAERHYADLSAKKFFPSLVDYIVSGPVIAMVWEGKGVILTGRKLLGATNPAESDVGTLRGDFSIDIGRNICHGSDGPDSAAHEIAMWFKPEEVQDYPSSNERWIYE